MEHSCVIHLRNAFDNLDLPILLKKNAYGYRGTFFEVLSDYSRNRFQYSRKDNDKIVKLEVNPVMSQGSIMGQLLFSVNNIDLPKEIKLLPTLPFSADDTSIMKSHP